jgi:hypothetical protein
MKTLTLASLVVAITAVAHSAFAQVPVTHQLVLTETSSTTLNVTYDGSGSSSVVDVNFISGDHWGVTVGFPVTFSGTPQWTELEDPSFVNLLTTFGNNQIIVNSDFFPRGSPTLSNGDTLANFGTDSRDGGSISATFRDRGDAPIAVPDTGSTFVLLFLSLAALVVASRFRYLRLA